MTAEPTPIRWHQSLIVRVIALCVVLILCLLGSVYVVTQHYYQEVATELRQRAEQIVQRVEVWMDEHPDVELDSTEIPSDLMTTTDGTLIQLEFVDEVPRAPEIVPALDEEGYVYVATQYFQRDGRWVQVTARIQIQAQTEIVRAFKNRNLIALTAAFLVAIGLMIYLIARTLRPLRDLSDTCAEISEGNLNDVAVRGTTGEVMALEQTFNRMVSSLREKEQVERNLRQAQRVSALGNLAAGVAHDVRNPLNAIKLLSSHAIDTLNGQPEAQGAVNQLQTIRNEVNRLEEIVSGFLSLAKEEELHLEPQNVDDLLRECLQLVKNEAEIRRVNLISELRAGDTSLMLDRKQWTRAVLNVLLNALEACPEGGRVRMFSRVTDRSCEVEVRDDGPGMSQEAIERAFDPYFTTKSTGTGLGLSITRGIIEEHGGSISITSTEGAGTQVLITVPLDQAAVR